MDTSVILGISQWVLGLLQGLTEIFPISSSAHTSIAHSILRWVTGRDIATFSTAVFLHLGSFIAILFSLRRDVVSLCRSAIQTATRLLTRQVDGLASDHPLGQHTPFCILFGVLVTALVGLLLRPTAEHVFSHPVSVTVFLSLNGALLLAASRYVRRPAASVRDIASLGWWDYLNIGVAQGLAVIPGVSRFGLTLVAGLRCGLGWYQSLRLSLLLSLPTVLAAVAWESLRISIRPPYTSVMMTIPGMIAAGLGAWVAIRVIRREDLHAQRALISFGAYCIAAGVFWFFYLGWLGV